MRWLLSAFRIRLQPPSWREVPGILLKWVAWGAISGPFWGLFFTLLSDPRSIIPFLSSPLNLATSAVIGMVFSLSFYVFCAPGNALLWFWAAGWRPERRLLAFVIYNVIACPLAFLCAALIVAHIPNSGIHIEIPYFWRILVIEGAAGAVVAIVIGSFTKLRLQVERTQTEAARAQALALQSQINPHFFFNTLNSISALVDDNPPAAKRMIGRLADMFRYTLGCTHTESVTLEQEIQFVRDYLDIERARFPERLRVDLPEGPFPPVEVPGLVLQPLVENAVKHGIARLIEGGVVAIRVTDDGATARISVRNTSDGESELGEGALYRTGHALENVRARLRLFTGQADPLRVSHQGGWTEFSFESAVRSR